MFVYSPARALFVFVFFLFRLFCFMPRQAGRGRFDMVMIRYDAMEVRCYE